MKKIIVMLVAFMGCTLNVYGATNPYSEKSSYGTNCTWYAWKMAYEKAGVALPGWHNAKDWYQDAINDGYSVGTTPKANSIVVWGTWTSYGHVGYVEKVSEDTIYVWDSTGPCIDKEDEEYIECMSQSLSETDDKICNANAPRVACAYSLDYYEITGFIYLDYEPQKKTTSSDNTTSNSNNSASKENTVTPKSSNANLDSIELDNAIIEFNQNTLEYTIEVEAQIDQINVNATPSDTKATTEGTGTYNLEVGLNKIDVTVIAEDGTTKVYTLYITRKEEQVEEENTSEEIIVDENNLEVESPEKSKINANIIVILSCLIVLILCLKRKKANHKKLQQNATKRCNKQKNIL